MTVGSEAGREAKAGEWVQASAEAEAKAETARAAAGWDLQVVGVGLRRRPDG